MGDKEHQINAELIQRFKSYYDSEHAAPLERLVHLITSPFTTHYTPVIDTTTYIHKSYSELSDKQIVDRTVFALKKIMTFNHHFFSVEESRILSPYPSGLINRSFLWTACAVNAGLATIMFRNRHFSPASFMLFGGLLGAEYVFVRVPNVVNNIIQAPSRKNLAKKYIEAYGGEFFHEINDPRFDVEKLRHLENKLNVRHHHH